MSSAEYQRRWRASKGARTGQPGRPATQPCGTVAAFQRHKRNGEEACEACRQANREHQAEMYRKRKGWQQPHEREQLGGAGLPIDFG